MRLNEAKEKIAELNKELDETVAANDEAAGKKPARKKRRVEAAPAEGAAAEGGEDVTVEIGDE